MTVPRVVILGGGPAGVGAAYQLHRSGKGQAVLFEQNDGVGGNAGSFDVDGVRVDFGSHRLHAACDPAILADIESMLGEDFGFFERHGRIRLRGRWLHFPLKPLDLFLRLDKGFALGAFRDMVTKALPGGPPEGETFASVLRANLGPTICEHFYFPYARKMWGQPPERLSGIQARKRVTAGTFKKLLKRLASPPGKGGYYYMRRGYGQISEAYADQARALGADLRLGWRVERLARNGSGWTVEASNGSERVSVEADQVWSTIPVTIVARIMDPAPPPEVLEAAGQIDYRAMVLAYLTLDVDQFTTTDAHYFPEENVCFTRLSEPKNYFRSTEPKGRTVLCAEIPCSPDDEVWGMDDEALGRRVAADMATAGLALARPPVAVRSRRLRQAYPIYPLGYEVPLGVLDQWVEGVDGLLSYGRQGLFAHDNTHHALYMAYSAVDCLRGTGFDDARWAEYREVFKTHVVED
ncbi:MAG: FAD-dependent oxidoreductase [Gemmatimonadota bacterium]